VSSLCQEEAGFTLQVKEEYHTWENFGGENFGEYASI